MFSEMGTRFLAWKSLESYLNMVFAEQQLSLQQWISFQRDENCRSQRLSGTKQIKKEL